MIKIIELAVSGHVQWINQSIKLIHTPVGKQMINPFNWIGMIETDIHSPVSVIMTKDTIAVNPDDPINRIVDVFKNHNFHHIPVLDKGVILGMISKVDLLKFYEEISRWVDGKHQTEYMMENATAVELMTKDIVTLKPSDTILYAVNIFKENYFRALPVVGEDGKLAGIVTTYDVLCYAFKPNYLEDNEI